MLFKILFEWRTIFILISIFHICKLNTSFPIAIIVWLYFLAHEIKSNGKSNFKMGKLFAERIPFNWIVLEHFSVEKCGWINYYLWMEWLLRIFSNFHTEENLYTSYVKKDVRQARGVIISDHLETLQAVCAQFVPNFQNLCLTVWSLGMTPPTWRQARGVI